MYNNIYYYYKEYYIGFIFDIKYKINSNIKIRVLKVLVNNCRLINSFEYYKA